MTIFVRVIYIHVLDHSKIEIKGYRLTYLISRYRFKQCKIYSNIYHRHFDVLYTADIMENTKYCFCDF